MEVKNTAKALVETLATANELAGMLEAAYGQMAKVPVPLDALPGEIQRRLDEYDLSISLLSEQSGVAINTVKKAITNPETMKIVTLQKVIEPLGMSLCFERR
ncbi:MAG: hypothetical protein P8X74_00275 [Reinekea sp.]